MSSISNDDPEEDTKEGLERIQKRECSS